MNCDRGFLQRLTVPVYLVEDLRGARHWEHIFVPQTSHEGGTVKARSDRCSTAIWTGSRIAHRRMFPKVASKRASVASLVLQPSRSSFSVSLIKAIDVGPVELWATRSVVQAQRQIHRVIAGRVHLAVSDPWLEPIY